jgi:hypothetical protein
VYSIGDGMKGYKTRGYRLICAKNGGYENTETRLPSKRKRICIFAIQEIDGNLNPVQEDFVCPEMKMTSMMMVISNMTPNFDKIINFLRRFSAPPSVFHTYGHSRSSELIKIKIKRV